MQAFLVLCSALGSLAPAQGVKRRHPLPRGILRDAAHAWKDQAPRIPFPVVMSRRPFHFMARPAPASLLLWGRPLRFYIHGTAKAEGRAVRSYQSGQSRIDLVILEDRRAREEVYFRQRLWPLLKAGPPAPISPGASPGEVSAPGSAACENLRTRLLFAWLGGAAREKTRSECAALFAHAEAEIALLRLGARVFDIHHPPHTPAPPGSRAQVLRALLCALRHSNFPAEVWRRALAPPAEGEEARVEAAQALAAALVAALRSNPAEHPQIDAARSIFAQLDRLDAATWRSLAARIARRISGAEDPISRTATEPALIPADFPFDFKYTTASLNPPQGSGLAVSFSKEGALRCTAGWLAARQENVRIERDSGAAHLRISADGALAGFFMEPATRPRRVLLKVRHATSGPDARILITTTWNRLVTAEHKLPEGTDGMVEEVFDLTKSSLPKTTNWVMLSLDPRHAEGDVYRIASLEVCFE